MWEVCGFSPVLGSGVGSVGLGIPAASWGRRQQRKAGTPALHREPSNETDEYVTQLLAVV